MQNSCGVNFSVEWIRCIGWMCNAIQWRSTVRTTYKWSNML